MLDRDAVGGNGYRPLAVVLGMAIAVLGLWGAFFAPAQGVLASPAYSVAAQASTVTPAPSPTPSGCTLQFTDVPSDSTFYPYVHCLACRAIIGGYPCGGEGEPCDPAANPYFRPNSLITRGQISKLVSESAGFREGVGNQIYEDVESASPFFQWVNRLTNRGLMGGYPCGGPDEPCVAPRNRPYFRPGANATRGQLAKIVSNSAYFSDPPTTHSFEDVPPGSQFYDVVERLVSRNIMGGYPCGAPGEPCVAPNNRPYFRWAATVTRGQASKIDANTFFPNCQVQSPR